MLFKLEFSSLDHHILNKLIFVNCEQWKKDFIVSKIEASQDGSPYVLVAFTDPNEPKSAGKSYPQSPFTSPVRFNEKSTSPTFRITMKEYEDMAIKVVDRVGMELIM